MASTAPSGPASSRARARRRRADRPSSIGGGRRRPSCRASDSSVAGDSARGLALLREHDGRAARQELAQHAGGVLVLEDRDHGDHAAGAARAQLGKRRRERAPCPPGCARRRRRSADRRSTTSKRPGTLTDAAASRTAPGPAARGRPRPRRARARSCAAGTPRGRRRRTPASSAGAWISARLALGDQARLGLDLGLRGRPTTSVPPSRTHGELLARDVDAPSGPASACARGPTLVSTWTARGDHVRRVVAPAQAGLDDRRRRPRHRQLGEGGGGEHLELGDPVVLRERAVDQLGRVRRALDGGREGGRGRCRAPSMRIRSANETRCGESVGAGRARRGGARIAAVMRTVEDLPFVPTTWIDVKRALRASRAPSSAGASDPGRSASRTARARAGGSPLAPGSRARSQRLQLGRAAARACRARPARRRAAPWPRSPRWPACPRRARSRHSISARCSRLASLGRRRIERRRRPAPRRPRRGSATEATGSPPSGASSRRASRATERDHVLVALGDQPGRQDGARRHLDARRASRAAPARPRSRARPAPRRPRRRQAGSRPTASRPASSPSAPGRSDQISSVTNGISGMRHLRRSREDVEERRRGVVAVLHLGRSRGLTSSRYQSHSSP